MKRVSLTTWSILALIAGLGLGILGHQTGSPIFDRVGEWLRTIGNLWLAALELTVLPLVITHLLGTITAAGAKSLGKLGIRAFFLFVGMLLAAGLFAIILTPLFLARLSLRPDMVGTLNAAAVSSRAGSPSTAEPNASTVSVAQWISRLLPTNILEAGVKGDVFSLLLFTGFFALAVTRLPLDHRLLLTNVFQALSEAMLQLVRWVLVATPIGVFALTFVIALETGVSTGGLLGAYIIIVSVIMVLFTLLIYPFSAFVGKTRISDFARGVAPAQLVAVSSRSSIAALPALIEGAKDRLHLPSTATSFVLPLSVSLFKVNRPISSIVKLMLVAHVYGIQLRTPTVIMFLVTVVIISFTAPGIPQSGPGLKTLPAYLAAGVPIEGVILVEAVEAIPDVFKTLLNVTGDMSTATILTRSDRLQSEVAPEETARDLGSAERSALDPSTP